MTSIFSMILLVLMNQHHNSLTRKKMIINTIKPKSFGSISFSVIVIYSLERAKTLLEDESFQITQSDGQFSHDGEGCFSIEDNVLGILERTSLFY